MMLSYSDNYKVFLLPAVSVTPEFSPSGISDNAYLPCRYNDILVCMNNYPLLLLVPLKP